MKERPSKHKYWTETSKMTAQMVYSKKSCGQSGMNKRIIDILEMAVILCEVVVNGVTRPVDLHE